MAYDAVLAQRVREALPRGARVVEKKMFGGLAFMIGDALCVGASSSGSLLVRVGPAARDEMLKLPYVRPMVMGEKMVAAFVYVDPPALRTDAQLRVWIDRALEFVATLAPASGAVRRQRTPREA